MGGGGGGGRAARLKEELPPISLPPKAEQSIWRAKLDFEAALERSAVTKPWLLVEKLADELLDELLQSSAEQLFDACDECVEQVCDGEVRLPPEAAAAAAAART